jgi:hypothetical protein
MPRGVVALRLNRNQPFSARHRDDAEQRVEGVELRQGIDLPSAGGYAAHRSRINHDNVIVAQP